ncbi:hypothetical protein I3843_05G078500 [Carya illinoinensis]|nr:hypothetical protein I3843_05G078500 [Carya illinoinensis]
MNKQSLPFLLPTRTTIDCRRQPLCSVFSPNKVWASTELHG